MDQQTFQWIIASVVLPTVGGVVTHISMLQRSISRERNDNAATIAKAKSSFEVSLNIQRQDQHVFQLKVAQEYATLSTLKDVENRVVAAINDVKADLHILSRKIDNISLRQTRDDP